MSSRWSRRRLTVLAVILAVLLVAALLFVVFRGGDDGTTGSAGPPKAGAQDACPCAQPTPAPTPADPAGAPAAPRNVTAALQPNGDVRIEWDDNAEPDLAYYAVRWSADKSKPQDQWTRLPQNWTTSEATHVAAPANTTVYYYVTAVDDGKLTGGKPQVSARSDVASADTTAQAGPTPTETPTPAPTSTPTPSPGPSLTAGVLWGSDFEDVAAGVTTPAKKGPLSALYGTIQHDYDSTVQCQIEVSAEQARTGAKSMKLTVGAPAATAATNDVGRCQPTVSYPAAAQGQDRWYGFSVYLKGWDLSQIIDNRSFFLGGFGFRYTNTSLNGPGANLGGRSGAAPFWQTGIDLSGTVGAFDAGVQKLGPIVDDKWMDFVFHVKWSSGQDGVLETWRDGVKMGSYSGPTLKAASYKAEHRVGVYEGVKVSAARVMFVDNHRIGSSYAAVDPSR